VAALAASNTAAKNALNYISLLHTPGARGGAVDCTTSRKAPGPIPDGVTRVFQ
jgi:hypothetical protein